jgi:hypothetical protein
MATTKQIPRAEWKTYFERYTRQHLMDDGGDVRESAYVEVMSPELGDQVEATLVPLLGMTYDPKSNAFELALEDLDHLLFRPTQISVIEEGDGFISALEVTRADGIKEIVRLARSASPELRPAP